MHQRVDPPAILLFENAGLKYILKAGLLTPEDTAVIEKAGIPSHISGTRKDDAEILELKSGSAKLRVLPLFCIDLEAIQTDYKAVREDPEMKHIVVPQAEQGVEILLDRPADRLLDCLFHRVILWRRRILRKSFTGEDNREERYRNKYRTYSLHEVLLSWHTRQNPDFIPGLIRDNSAENGSASQQISQGHSYFILQCSTRDSKGPLIGIPDPAL